MLVDLKTATATADEEQLWVVRALGEPLTLTRHGRGLYEGGVNSHHAFADVIRDEWPFDPWPAQNATDDELRAFIDEYRRRIDEDGWPYASYGVSDSLPQVVERYPVLETDPRPLVVIGSVVRRDEQPEYGGWRWHKWGPYVGNHEPAYEYLYDEVGIDQVWVWHIYEVALDSYTTEDERKERKT